MILRFGLAMLFALTLFAGHASADQTGTVQQSFQCPAGNCTTTCVGPGGPQEIKNYTNLTAWMFSQPDRLWLEMFSGNNLSFIVLGVGDRCTFGGTPQRTTIPPSNTGPPPTPPCVCIGTPCTCPR